MLLYRASTNKKQEYNIIKSRLAFEINKLITHGVCYFGTGGALSFDAIAELTILEFKQKFPNIKLILVLPCFEQTKYWKLQDIKIYDYIKTKADKIVYVSKDYTPDCMFKRNRHLLNNSSYCICYLLQEHGGTYYTVNYAKKGLKIINCTI